MTFDEHRATLTLTRREEYDAEYSGIAFEAFASDGREDTYWIIVDRGQATQNKNGMTPLAWAENEARIAAAMHFAGVKFARTQ